jgi:hypothetical protein
MKIWFGLLLAIFCGFSAVVVCRAESQQPVRIEVDPFCRRAISGESELRRERWFAMCHSGRKFQERVPDRSIYDYLIKTNNITFGRSLGLVNGLQRYYRAVREDKQRPGFVDQRYMRERLAAQIYQPQDSFRADMQGRLDVVLHGRANAYPEFMGHYILPQAGDPDKAETFRVPQNIDAAAEMAAAVMRDRYTGFDRPHYYEPVNEPHWAYWDDLHFAQWHVATRAAVRRECPEVLVGGPCLSVAYFYRKNFSAFKGLRAFIDNTHCGLDFYSFHVYDFLCEGDEDFSGRITGGLPLEGVLDLVQNYTINVYGKEVALVVSEHGGYGAEGMVERLAANFFPGAEGFEREIKKRSIDDFNMVSSVLANTLTFMEHPHVVRKAVPFILPEAMSWDPHYYATLYVARDFKDKRDWVPTQKILFYKFLRDLRGHRIVALCEDPDVQTRGFVDDNTAFVVLNNLSNYEKRIELAMPAARHYLMRRLGRSSEFTPYLREKSSAELDVLHLRPREALLVKADYQSDLTALRTVNETPFYGDQIALTVDGEAIFNVAVPQPENLRYAVLRIGISRPPDAARDIDVWFNNNKLCVPLEQCAERLVEQEYASCKIVPLPVGIIQADNQVRLVFADGKPGAVGAVVIRTAVER